MPYRTVEDRYRQELNKTPETIQRYMRDNYFAGEWQPAYDSLVDIQAGWIRGPDYEHLAWVPTLTSDMIFIQAVVHEFPDITQPTLLIIGIRDRTALGRIRCPRRW